jgi:hypothetical protein
MHLRDLLSYKCSLFELITLILFFLHFLCHFVFIIVGHKRVDLKHRYSFVLVFGVKSLYFFVFVHFLIKILIDRPFVQSILPILSSHKCKDQPLPSDKLKLILQVRKPSTLADECPIVVF